MRRIFIVFFAALLLAPMAANATEGNENGSGLEALPDDVTDTWNAINNGLTNTAVNALAIDPTNPSILYAGTKGGVFKSTDWGENWNAINNGLTNTHVWTLAIDSSNTDIIYAGTNGGVFKSTNGGGGWSAVNNGLTYTDVWALAIDPSNTSILYAGTVGYLYKSTDAGMIWSPSNLTGVDGLAIDPSNTSVLYANTQNSGIHKSTDGGESWFPILKGLTCVLGYTLTMDPTNPNTIYAGNSCAVYKSTDGGESWIAILVTSFGLAVGIDPTDPGIVYAGTWGLGIYKSTDGGKTWIRFNTGLTAAGLLVTALAIDPTNPRLMYAGTYAGVFKSFPAGTLSLYVSNAGTGEGSVTSSPSGIDCGSICAATYDEGTGVTLTATPSTGSIFAGWSGACSGTGDCVVTMDANKLVTATFNEPGQSGVNISVVPESLNFGSVNVGLSREETITITNQTNSTATLSGSVGTLSGPFSVVSGGGAFDLAPGQSVTVTVQFLPATAGEASANLFISHNAANQPNPANVPLSGTGVGSIVSGISVTPTTGNYGNVKVNKNKSVSFKVKNTGKGDLIILYSRIKGPDGSMFTITSGRGGKVLTPGKTMTIKVTFKPSSTGLKSATLEITSNDRVAPIVNVPLSGTGQ